MSTATSEDANRLIDGATTPEGKAALEAALLAELNASEGKTPASTEEEPPAPEKKDGGPAPKEGEEPEPSDPGPKAKPPEVKGKDGEGSPDDGGEAHDPNGRKPTRTGKKIEKLLSQRNSARAEAEEEKARADKAEADLAELKRRREAGEELPDEDEPNDPEAIMDRKLDERDAKRAASQRRADLDKQEREALVSKFEPSKEELDDLDAVLKAHPGLSDEAALAIAAPHLMVAGTKDKSGARRQAAGASTRTMLREEPSFDKMSATEQKAYIEEEVRAGRMSI